MSAADRWLDDAAAWALGQLEGEALARFERALASGEPGAVEAADAFSPVAARVGLLAPTARPSARLKRRLLSRVGDDVGEYVLRADDGEWERPADGLRVRRLFVEPADERETRGLELSPGAHDLREWLGAGCGVFVWSGSCEIDATAHGAGDWRRLGPGGAATPVRAIGPVRLIVFPAARGSGSAVADARSVRAGRGQASSFGEGTEARLLEADPATGGTVLDVRMRPGAALPRHRHGGAEQVLLLEGDCTLHGRTYAPGDFLRARAGTVHGVATTVGGCRMLNRIEGALEPL